jgi:hypothetical protein
VGVSVVDRAIATIAIVLRVGVKQLDLQGEE